MVEIDVRLREQVRLLGELLGQTIADQHGAAFLDKRRPRFWAIREREREARQALADEYDKDKGR